MAQQKPVPEADAIEQTTPLEDAEELEVEELGLEVPEADALEQARPLAGAAERRLRLRPDVPEADALEQVRPAGEDDEDDRR